MNCFHYTDHIQICTLAMEGDYVYMHGAMTDPLTGKLLRAFFQAEFSTIYDILSPGVMYKSEVALAAMLHIQENPDEEPFVEFAPEDIVQIHGMVLRLATVVGDEDEDEDEEEEEDLPPGFYIHDGFYLENGDISLHQHIKPTSHLAPDKKKRRKILATYKKLSFHLSTLALRYYYYLSHLKAGTPKEDALFLSCLQDEIVYAAARQALIITDSGYGFLDDILKLDRDEKK